MKAKAFIDECQAMQVETRRQLTLSFHNIKNTQHIRYMSSIIVEWNEDRLSIDSPLLMDHMFEEDLVMERLRHESQ